MLVRRIFAVTFLASVFFAGAVGFAGGGPYLTYRNALCGFEIRYPSGGEVGRLASRVTRIDLPFAPGTTLREKYLLIDVDPGKESSSEGGEKIEGMKFWFELGSEGAVGSIYDFIRCTVMLGNGCRVAFTFILHSVNPGMFDLPPPPFDRGKEALPFWLIISSLRPLQQYSDPPLGRDPQADSRGSGGCACGTAPSRGGPEGRGIRCTALRPAGGFP